MPKVERQPLIVMRAPPVAHVDEPDEETLLSYLDGAGTAEERARFEAGLDELSRARLEILAAALAEED